MTFSPPATSFRAVARPPNKPRPPTYHPRVRLAVPVPQSPPTSRFDHRSLSYRHFSEQKQQIYNLAEARGMAGDPQEGSPADFKGSTLHGHLSIHIECPKMPKIPGPHSLSESTPTPTSQCQGISCFQADFFFGGPWGFFFILLDQTEAGCLSDSLKKKKKVFDKRFLRNKSLCFLCKSMGGQGGHRGHRRSQGSQGVQGGAIFFLTSTKIKKKKKKKIFFFFFFFDTRGGQRAKNT